MKKRVWLLQLRKKCKLSQQQVADAVLTTQQNYSYIEKGERRPSPELAKKIGSLFGFEWTRFFEEDMLDNETSATKETA